MTAAEKYLIVDRDTDNCCFAISCDRLACCCVARHKLQAGNKIGMHSFYVLHQLHKKKEKQRFNWLFNIGRDIKWKMEGILYLPAD